MAILLNSFVGAINAAEREELEAAALEMKSKEMLRSAPAGGIGRVGLTRMEQGSDLDGSVLQSTR